jgi:hypothetical protein
VAIVGLQSRIQWREVAREIVRQGGSYQFYSTTCKKRFLELVKAGKATALSSPVPTRRGRRKLDSAAADVSTLHQP